MISDRQFRTDELIRAAAELPQVDPALRKRVLRAAREAQQRRLLRKRLQWALGGSAAAILLAAVFSALIEPRSSGARYAPSAMGQSTPSVLHAPESASDVDSRSRTGSEKPQARTNRAR